MMELGNWWVIALFITFVRGFFMQGFVISAPKHSLDIVQIKITYHKIESDNENDDDIKVSTCLWKRALHVARSAKGYPSSMIKYQCNFNLLIQEVLGNSRHLFKADEIDFLGITADT